MSRHLLLTYFTLLSLPLMAQRKVQGTIVDASGSAVFASVYTNSGLGTICDSLGHFSFEIPTNENRLYIQSLGYNSETLLLADNTDDLNICLSENAELIDEVGVVAYRSIESKSTVSAFSTDKKEMMQLNPKSVGQVLQMKAGFTNRSTYQAPLTLRGMSGRRILVLRNGNRRFSSYPAGVMTHTINVYDLDRIEVEKGAASVVYGAGAMAGIINLIDKSPFRQEGFNAKFTTGYGSVNKEKSVLACGGWSNGKLALKGGLRYRDADDFRYPNGELAENSFYADKDVFLTTGYQFSERHNLVFTADIHDGGPWGKPVGFNGTNYMRVLTQEEKSNNYTLKYKHDKVALFDNMEFDVFYSNESRELLKNYYAAAGYMLSYTETTHFSDFYYGTLLKGDIPVNDHYSITAGAEIYRFYISTPTDMVDYIDDLEYSNRVSADAKSTTSGVFMQNNYQINEAIKGVVGMRYNYASVFEGEVYSLSQTEGRNENQHAWSGNAAAIFTLSRSTHLKVNVARSFRMPETTELYADSYTSNGVLYGNPDLKPEYCNSVDVSYVINKELFKVELSPFVWSMKDMMTKEEIKGMTGTNYTYINVGKTRLFGLEATASLNFNSVFKASDKLTLRTGMAYLNGTDMTDAESFFAEGTPLDYMPPFNVKSDLKYAGRIRDKVAFNLALNAIYYSEQKRLGEAQYATPRYCILGANLGLNFFTIKTQPSLNVAVNNMTNKAYYSYLSYLPSAGRDIRIFLTFNLNK